jgi:hypothetical protein
MAIGTAAAIALGVGALGSAAIGASAARRLVNIKNGQLTKESRSNGLHAKKCVACLKPYVAAGGPALEAQMGALGLRGPEAQQAYVAEQEQSPIYQALAAPARRSHSTERLSNWRTSWRQRSRRIGSVPPRIAQPVS